MADIGSELITYLKTKSAITSLVGSGSAARIYCDDAKQGVDMPYIVIVVYPGESHERLGGIVGVATNRCEINCYAATSSAAFSLAEAVRLAPLQMHRGTLGATFCHNISSPQSYGRDFDPPTTGDNRKRFNVSRDYFITHTEATS